MRFRLEFFSGPSGPDAAAYPICGPAPVTCESVEAARNLGKTTAEKPEINAQSFTLESVDGKLRERWIRSGDSWARL